MQFNSFIYILLFLPIVVFTYFLGNKINDKLGKLVVIIASIIFYAYSGWTIFVALGISIILNYIFAQFILRFHKWNKIFVFIPLVVNVGLLLYFKYFNFMITNVNSWFGKQWALKEIVMPLGISFFTFQQIAYIVAVYKKEVNNCSLIDYLVYILYFPKILMGPLADPVDFIAQLNDKEKKSIDLENIACGIKIFSFGLFKKVMLADVFAGAVSWGYANIEVATAMDWILITLFYTFNIYFDFSGYSDMAVGSSLMLNITLPINFDSPYKALSIRDFWKRWHISLTKFFTKYVYIPLGGSRKGLILTCVNTMIVFLISGIWHGANWTFILWGLLHGLFMVLERLINGKDEKIFEPVRWFLTFVVVNVLWLLFRSESITQWGSILQTIGNMQSTAISDGLINKFSLSEMNFISNILNIDTLVRNTRGFWMLAYIVGCFGICLIPDNNYKKCKTLSFGTLVLAIIAFIWGFICLSSESVFVYFDF